jgi:hypothetical protein
LNILENGGKVMKKLFSIRNIIIILLIILINIAVFSIMPAMGNANNTATVYAPTDTTANVQGENIIIEGVNNNNAAYYNEQDPYIEKVPNNAGGVNYIFSLDDVDIDNVELGDQYETNDYIYTYGYYWNTQSDSYTAQYGSLENWTPIPLIGSEYIGPTPTGESYGWGVAVKNRSQTTYEPVYDTLRQKPVTCLFNTFCYCKNMRSLPTISVNTAFMQNMCSNDESLQVAILPEGLTQLSICAFSNCSSLECVYIPRTVATIPAMEDDISASPFYGCKALTYGASHGLVIYCETATVPSSAEWYPKWNVTHDTSGNEVQIPVFGSVTQEGATSIIQDYPNRSNTYYLPPSQRGQGILLGTNPYPKG